MVTTRTQTYDKIITNKMINAVSKKECMHNEVKKYISELKEDKYNLRSTKQQKPRINYYRFYTSRPDDYPYHHYIRRSERINSMKQ
jgi:hypothetical protein